MTPTHIKLSGGKADRFEELRKAESERCGYDLSNPEFVGRLMLAFDEDESIVDVVGGA